MRYIMTIVWAIIISTVLSYVLTSMEGEPFVLSEALILGVTFSIIVIVLGEFILKEKKAQ